jgi:hypothetical protein
MLAGKIQCGIFHLKGIAGDQTRHFSGAVLIDTSQNGGIVLAQNERIVTHWEPFMNVSAKPLVVKLYRAYLRSRLERYTRDLQAIAEQRENDFQAERILHQAVVSVRSKLHSL